MKGFCGLVLFLIFCPSSAWSQADCDTKCLFEQVESGELDLMNIDVENLTLIRNEQDQSLIFPAVFFGHGDFLESLLARGLDPNARDMYGASPLMYAASEGQSDVVRLLLESGADPNLTDEYFGWTALMYACFEGDLESTKLLLEAGALLELTSDPNGDTALMKSAFKGFDEVVDFLISAGADCNKRNALGFCAADMAEMAGHETLTSKLKSAMKE